MFYVLASYELLIVNTQGWFKGLSTVFLPQYNVMFVSRSFICFFFLSVLLALFFNLVFLCLFTKAPWKDGLTDTETDRGTSHCSPSEADHGTNGPPCPGLSPLLSQCFRCPDCHQLILLILSSRPAYKFSISSNKVQNLVLFDTQRSQRCAD